MTKTSSKSLHPFVPFIISSSTLTGFLAYFSTFFHNTYSLSMSLVIFSLWRSLPPYRQPEAAQEIQNRVPTILTLSNPDIIANVGIELRGFHPLWRRLSIPNLFDAKHTILKSYDHCSGYHKLQWSKLYTSTF